MVSRLRLTRKHFTSYSFTTRMSSFILPKSNPEVIVNLTPDLSKDQLLSFPAFKAWISTLQHSLSTQNQKSHTFHSTPYRLRTIDIQSVDFFGSERIGFIKLKTNVSNDNGEKLPGSVFLRGGSVGMMLILQPDDVPAHTETEKQVILTVQARIPAGSLSMLELPAGMLDDAGTFAGAAAKEIAEETGLHIPAEHLINMTELALPHTTSSSLLPLSSSSSPSEVEQLQQAIYPSPGGCDEFISIFLWQKRVPRRQLQEWQGKLTGLRDRGEKIKLMLVPLEEVWKIGARDAKVLAGWALYEGLRRDGRL